MSDSVVLVDTNDRPLGTADKLEAHHQGWLHRAFSVFVFDAEGRLLLQQRNGEKYHSGGLWSNTCCSHPLPGEAVADATQRRMVEEMGFTCAVERAFGFTYRAEVGDNLQEHEYDHVFIGYTDTAPAISPNPAEVSDWRWTDPHGLRADVAAHPERYTVWFRMVLDRTLEAAQARVASPGLAA
jgi:isopentenyl-diphosphate delta-isomerase